jgi:hypothetical protein
MKLSSLYFSAALLCLYLAYGCVSSVPHPTAIPATGIGELSRTMIQSFDCQDASITTIIIYLSETVRKHTGKVLQFAPIPEEIGVLTLSLCCNNISAMDLLFLVTARCGLAIAIVNDRISLVAAKQLALPSHPLFIADDGILCPIFNSINEVSSLPEVNGYDYLDFVIKSESKVCSLRKAFSLLSDQAHIAVEIKVENETAISACMWDLQNFSFAEGELSVRDLLKQAIFLMNDLGFPRSLADDERGDVAIMDGSFNDNYRVLAYLMDDKIVIRSFWVQH